MHIYTYTDEMCYDQFSELLLPDFLHLLHLAVFKHDKRKASEKFHSWKPNMTSYMDESQKEIAAWKSKGANEGIIHAAWLLHNLWTYQFMWTVGETCFYVSEDPAWVCVVAVP